MFFFLKKRRLINHEKEHSCRYYPYPNITSHPPPFLATRTFPTYDGNVRKYNGSYTFPLLKTNVKKNPRN